MEQQVPPRTRTAANGSRPANGAEAGRRLDQEASPRTSCKMLSQSSWELTATIEQLQADVLRKQALLGGTQRVSVRQSLFSTSRPSLSRTSTRLSLSSSQTRTSLREESMPSKASSTQSKDLVMEENRHHIPGDMWGAFIVCLVKDFAEVVAGHDTWYTWAKLAILCGAMLINLSLTIVLLYFVNSMLVNPSIAKMQRMYAEFHQVAFDAEGSFLFEEWKHWDKSLELCTTALANKTFTGFVLFLWSARMMGELVECFRLASATTGTKKLQPGVELEDMVVEDESGLMATIDQLSNGFKTAIFVCVIIPKLLVAILLLYAGAVFLCSAIGFENVIMNALSMEFILHIDNIIFEYLVPKVVQETVMRTSFGFVPNNKKREWYIATAAIVLSGLFVVSYLHFQKVIPDFKDDISSNCHGHWFDQNFQFACHKEDSFESCFPYGHGGSTGPYYHNGHYHASYADAEHG